MGLRTQKVFYPKSYPQKLWIKFKGNLPKNLFNFYYLAKSIILNLFNVSLTMTIKLEQSWLNELREEFNKDYMKSLKAFLKREKEKGKIIYPKGNLIFASFNSTPLDKIKAVILGQDPYHGPGQAHGMSFSVPRGIPVPPSLRNIFKEIERDFGSSRASTGNLEPWAHQGVLLLNSVLTVEKSLAGSHSGKGWEEFTDKAIEVISNKRNNIVFMLWGSYAQKKGALIDKTKHLILKSAHPSPLSAHKGFLGNSHFSKCNEYLSEKEIEPIDWSI